MHPALARIPRERGARDDSAPGNDEADLRPIVAPKNAMPMKPRTPPTIAPALLAARNIVGVTVLPMPAAISRNEMFSIVTFGFSRSAKPARDDVAGTSTRWRK